MENFWNRITDKKPHSYETGNFDGKKSDQLLFCDDNGKYFVGVCYQGFMDGSEFCDIYDENDFEVENAVYWAEIPII